MYSQVGVFMAHVLDVIRLLQLDDVHEGLAVAGRGSASSEEDEVKWTVLVLVSKLDGCLAHAGCRVIITTQVTVSVTGQHTAPKSQLYS